MEKNFEDFPGVSEDEIGRLFVEVANGLGIDADGEEMRIPVERAAVFAAAYSNAFTMRALRRYHEWVNS